MLCLRLIITCLCVLLPTFSLAELRPLDLRCEYLDSPSAVESAEPRLSWRVESDDTNVRGERQTAYRILVATTEAMLKENQADLWDSGKVESGETLQIAYAGKPLGSGQLCYWTVQVWNKDGIASAWSRSTKWQMGLLSPDDWKAKWIAFKDSTPVHADRKSLNLPAARNYRKDFLTTKKVRQATAYASALGNYRLYLNGNEVSDGYFLPGWSDYQKRAYYQAIDVTASIQNGSNCLGAIVSEGWYAGYVGYGLLVGYGPNKAGKNFYGKTPSLLVQVNVEYEDGSVETIVTDPSWVVSSDGPIREADIIMGESYDASKADKLWCAPTQAFVGLNRERDIWKWEPAVVAEANGSTKATYSDAVGSKEVELGFQKPLKMQSHTGVPVRSTQELPAKTLSEPKPGVYIFDLGQNFAGVVRLKVAGNPGQKIQIRYGEMLHPDGRLMTENLRRARATDYYVCVGDPDGETWTPQFTYHGFQYVEVSGLTAKPSLDAVVGIVLTSDTAYASSFACSDEVLTQFWKNGQWTQRANFVEIPTDCPQRDERLGWMGDAQAYVRTASFNADIAAFFTKWLDDVEESQRDFGAYPDYAPYPMAHGGGKATHGTAWTDAGIICPWTIWKVYGDVRLVERHWDSMTRFMVWRRKSDPTLKGVKIGNPWGDWLNVNEDTSIEYIDLCYHAYTCQLMAEMAEAIGKQASVVEYRKRLDTLRTNFVTEYVDANGDLKLKTQSAHVLAISCGLFTDANQIRKTAKKLAERIEANGTRMATGFLGTKSLLPALTMAGQHDLACRLFQSRQFPSWGYEASNGATSVWERWDSYTKEHGFDGITGKNNAAMNSFSHYAFGAVMEWAYRDLVGIDTDGPGYRKIIIKPGVPSVDSRNIDPMVPVFSWAKAEYVHHRGTIRSSWKSNAEKISVDISVPANTTATVYLPSSNIASITESGKPLGESKGIETPVLEHAFTKVKIGSGDYRFKMLRK